MKRYSRWTWVFFALAFVILAGGAAAALLVWQARSSSTQEFLDPEAAGDITLSIVDNTASIAEDWMASDLSGDLSSLAIKEQESLALLSGEVNRTEDLLLQVQEPPEDEGQEPPQNLLEALDILAQAQADLEQGLMEIGSLLAPLEPLNAAEAAYTRGRELLLAAVESHNQVVAAEPTSFAEAIQEAESAAAALQDSMAVLDGIKIEGLDLGSAASATAGLESTAQRFVEACRRGESDDAEGHNSLLTEVQAELSAAPASILSFIDLSAWLGPQIDSYMQPVIRDLEEARALINDL
jgi:hypothetical protein